MELRTERLLLREFAPDDWAAVLAYQADPGYLRYYAWTDRTEADVRTFVQMFIDQQGEQPRRKFQLAVTLDGFRSPSGLIGNCGIRRKPDNDFEADIGYEISHEHWGRGYATEAAAAIVRFGFEELRLHRISATCVADNTASARVMEKLGMRREGRLRESAHFKDRWWDALVYAVLEDEWRALTVAR